MECPMECLGMGGLVWGMGLILHPQRTSTCRETSMALQQQSDQQVFPCLYGHCFKQNRDKRRCSILAFGLIYTEASPLWPGKWPNRSPGSYLSKWIRAELWLPFLQQECCVWYLFFANFKNKTKKPTEMVCQTDRQYKPHLLRKMGWKLVRKKLFSCRLLLFYHVLLAPAPG